MTLICKPKGRGNWHVYELRFDRQAGTKRRAGALELDMFTIKVGDVIPFGPWTFRVIEVRP